ncbi:MAG: hypothetical protein ACYDH4_11265 [Candidatus Cryosericum sp.]
MTHYTMEIRHKGCWKRVGIFKAADGHAALQWGELLRQRHHGWAHLADCRVRAIPRAIYLLLIGPQEKAS